MMRVLRGFWKLLVGIKDALVLLLLLLFFGALYATLSARPNPQLASSGALVIRLDGVLVEQPSEADPWQAVVGSNPATREFRLREVIRAIDGAAGDTGVKAIVLDLDRFLGGGQAAIGEVGAALDRARRAGKPVLVFATAYADDGYQLAAHASEVWLDPMGAILIAGPGSQHLYYKGLLDKLGVTAHVYRVGRFKSAVEPFILDRQSPEAREANQALADTLFTTWRDDVAKARPKAQLAAYQRAMLPGAALPPAGAGSRLAGAAQASGLIDRLGDRIAFGARVAELAGAGDRPRAGGYAALPLDRYLAANAAPAAGQVGVLTIAGDIVDGEHGPGTAGGDTIARLLLDELAKKRIKALVVRIDSPGGSVTASERIRTALAAAKVEGLPIVVSMGSVAASGGYWVATPATTIFAEPSTITGSIGVFGVIPTFAGSLARLGLTADGVATTPLSGQPDLYHGTNPAFDAMVQGSIEDVYGRFTGLVAAARRLSPERVDAIGQGRVWAGGPARQIGLVDRFGGLDEAIAFAAKTAGLSGADARPRWIEREPRLLPGLLRGWLERPDGGDGGQDAVSLAIRRSRAMLAGAVGEAIAIADGPAIQARCLGCGASAGAHAATVPASGLFQMFRSIR